MPEVNIPPQDQAAILELSNIIQPLSFETVKSLVFQAYKLGYAQGALDTCLERVPK